MNDHTRREGPNEPVAPAGRVRELLGRRAADVTVAAVWAALIVAIVLFSGVVSQFAYVDF